jgi:hypothetical protein
VLPLAVLADEIERAVLAALDREDEGGDDHREPEEPRHARSPRHVSIC